MPSSTAPRPARRLRPEQFGPAVKAAAALFPPGNPHGVFGVAIRRRRVRGRELPYCTLGLFVARKQDDPRARIEPIGFRHRGAAYAVIPDIVATGQPAGATRGHMPVFTGLHPGASIRVDAGHRCAGGASCLLSADGGPTHLLTAGHIFPPARGRFAVSAAGRPGGVEIPIGRLWLNLLDGEERPMDVAVVELNPHGVRMALDSAARPRTPRLHAHPFDSDFVDLAHLKVFLPTTGDYHALRSAAVGPSRFRLTSNCRPPHSVADVIITDFANNTAGNSGTILMTDERDDDPVSSAVGVAIGFAGTASLHEPIDRALRLIAAASGQGFKIWTHGR